MPTQSAPVNLDVHQVPSNHCCPSITSHPLHLLPAADPDRPFSQTHRDLILPLSRYLCCCCSPATREYYFLNDWLGGSWFFYWGSCFVTFVSGIIFLVELAAQDTLQIWIMGTS